MADRVSQVRVMALDQVGLEGFPSDPLPFRERRSFYEGKKHLPQDPVGAEAYLRRAVAAFPDDAEAIGELAFALYLQGRHAEAKPLYERALALLDSPDIRVRYARLLYHMGRYGEAEAGYRQVLAVKPGYPLARFTLAKALLEQGKGEEARRLLREELRANPDPEVERFLREVGE
jgi:tetratricopeptide (TPR) repeat protein